MRAAPLLVLALLATTSLSGCATLRDLFDQAARPDLDVRRTPWRSGEWTNESPFEVQVAEDAPHAVRIEATRSGGVTQRSNGTSSNALPAVALELDDGTWDVSYFVDDHRWERLRGVRLDTTPPNLSTLPSVADATDRSYVLGAGVAVEPGASLRVIDQSTGAQIATSLPVTLANLTDGVHAFDVVAEDPAGNVGVATVQVRVGDATVLPDGQYTFGAIARYRQSVALWDLTDLGAYLPRADARALAKTQTNGGYVGSGFGITPTDPAVTAVVADVVSSSDNSAETALKLFEWMADHLEYDDQRLGTDSLLSPSQTLLDKEDPADADTDGDGLVRDGSGNGVAGGVCRDLAAAYVSLLRAAGVPARLVAGYLAGDVNGFHAWVEVLVGGDGPSPWMPVDVSPIDGPSSPAIVLQAFGIHVPSHLPLRVVTEAQEQSSWSQAVGVEFTFRGAKPDVQLGNNLTTVFATKNVLCINEATLERHLAASGGGSKCSRFFKEGFESPVEVVLDWGVTVASAGSGTRVTGFLAYPTGLPAGIAEHRFYGASFTPDAATGLATATWVA